MTKKRRAKKEGKNKHNRAKISYDDEYVKPPLTFSDGWKDIYYDVVDDPNGDHWTRVLKVVPESVATFGGAEYGLVYIYPKESYGKNLWCAYIVFTSTDDKESAAHITFPTGNIGQVAKLCLTIKRRLESDGIDYVPSKEYLSMIAREYRGMLVVAS